MGIFDLFKKKEKSPNYTTSNATVAPPRNENVDIIMGRKPNAHNTLLFYRKQWVGKGESGVDWIILKYRRGNCLVSFKSANAGYSEPLPSLDSIKQKNCSIPCDEIIRWDYKKFFDFVAGEFAVVLSTDNCITEDEYNRWLEKLRLLSCVADKICENDQHHFTDLKHFTGGSECRCQICGLVVKFNRGWPDRIEPSEMNKFMKKYKGSKFEF